MPIQEGLILKNYKEPLTEVTGGFGYYGAILITKDGEGIQCHLCGKTFASLSSHIWQIHTIRVREYKDKFGIGQKTALLSEKERSAKKQRMLDYIKSLSLKERKLYWVKRIDAFKKWQTETKGNIRLQPQKSLEGYNKTGTCVLQLLKKIREVSIHLDKTPTLKEFVKATGSQRYKYAILRVFGSWGTALKQLGMRPKRSSRNMRYSREELLEYLRDFKRENGTIPTSSDMRRSLLPSVSTYWQRFGSLSEARKLAGITQVDPQIRASQTARIGV